MAFTSKTYTVGTNGGVRRLDNLTAPWVGVPLSSSVVSPSVGDLVDVETDPTNGDHVYVVGDVNCFGILPVYYGIAVSNNAGVSWSVPFGNYSNAVTDSECDYTWYEVTVVDANTAYVCGKMNTTTFKGVVVKTTDGGSTFNQCTALPNTVNNMDATAIHFISPLIGVVALNDYIIKTTDGGVTWTVLNGGVSFTSNTAPIGQITGIHMSSDQQTILANGTDYIIRTVNGGINAGDWGFCLQVNNSSLRHMDGFTDNDVFVSGIKDSIVYTPDGGGSWSACPYALPSGLPNSGPDRTAFHIYRQGSNFEGFVNNGNPNIQNTLQAHCVPVPASPNDETSPYNVNAVWTWYQTIPPDPRCYLLTNCETSATIVVSTNLASMVGQVISIVEAPGCWTVSLALDCTGSIAVTIVSTSPDCQTCVGTCYLLVPCDGVSPNILTNTNLASQLGMVVTLVGSPICYVVNTAPGCQGATPVTIDQTYDLCVNCHPTCYLLTDCETGTQIITSQDLSAYVQQVIKLQNCPDKCWTVDVVFDCTGSVPSIPPILSIHTTCDDCLGVLPPEPLKLRPRRVKPGYDTPGCSPEYTEKVSCNFASQVWDSMASIRFGINSCCEDDLTKWDIKKQLLDFRAIYDPELCKNTICQCPDPCNVRSLIEIPYADTCIPPSNVDSEIILPAPCPNPDNTGSVIIILP